MNGNNDYLTGLHPNAEREVNKSGFSLWVPPEMQAAAAAAQSRFQTEQVNPTVANARAATEQMGMTGSTFGQNQLNQLKESGQLNEQERAMAARYGYTPALNAAMNRNTGFGAAMARYSMMGGPQSNRMPGPRMVAPRRGPANAQSFGGIMQSFIDDTPLDSYGY